MGGLRHTVFSRLHPLAMLVFGGAALLPGLTAGRPAGVCAAALALALAGGVTQDGGLRLRAGWKFLLVMALAICLLTPLFNREGKTVLFSLLGGPVTLEALLTGLTAALSLLTVLALFWLLSAVISSEAFLYLSARALPQTSLVLLLSARFVPELTRRLGEILSVRLGGEGKAPLTARLRRGTDALTALFSWALEDAVVTAQSMRARGYGLVRRRSVYHPYRFRPADLPPILLSAALAPAACILPAPWGDGAWLALISTPLCMEGWDALRWRLYSLKT